MAAFRLMTNSNLVGCVTGKSAGFSPLRIPAFINAGFPISVRKAAVAYETACGDELTIIIDCRNGVTFRQRDQLLAPAIKERIGGYKNRSRSPLCRNHKGETDLVFTACL